jgi:hypothetical protein
MFGIIDEERFREDTEETVAFYHLEAQVVDDFDWDPSDNVAGGMSVLLQRSREVFWELG